MNDPFDDIDLSAPKKKPPPKSKRDMFKSAGGTVTRMDTQKATGDSKGMHGQYKQANFRLRLEIVDAIDEWADLLNCNKSQLKRYIAWRGLQALQDGERPDYTDSGQRDLVDY